MLALISPAKRLDFEGGCGEVAHTQPEFLRETRALVRRRARRHKRGRLRCRAWAKSLASTVVAGAGGVAAQRRGGVLTCTRFSSAAAPWFWNRCRFRKTKQRQRCW